MLRTGAGTNRMLRSTMRLLCGIALGTLLAQRSAAAPAPVPAARPAKGPPEFTFVVATDPHLAQASRRPLPSGVELFQRLIDTALKRPRPPEFMILVGDIMLPLDPQTRLPDVSLLTAAAQRLPIYPVAGNFDFQRGREALRKAFPDVFGDRDFYSFTRHQCRFVVLCDAAVGDHYGHITSDSIRGQPQWAWLESQLERDASARRIFVFGHIPPHPTGADAVMYLSLGDQKLFAELVSRYTPDALFFGSCHSRLDFVLGTSPVHVLPSCHWNLQSAPPAFVEVSVFPDSVGLEYIDLAPCPLTGTPAP